MRPVIFLIMFQLHFSLSTSEKHLTSARGMQYDDNDEDEDEHIEIFNEDDIDLNRTDKGMYLGSPCEFTCSPKLIHVFCNPVSGVCECDKRHPVKLNPATGCGKPKRLGEQCYYREACKYSDQHASCVQVHHNAVCQCKSGYHIVSIQKPSKRVFCAEGSRRPSLTSIHSTSSVRSFSARRFEREKEQKEEREMQRRFARIASNGRVPPTPSPRSTDELLPTLTEDRPVYIVQVPLAIQEEDNGANGFKEEIPSTSKQFA
ncbi:uncharacterized protein LOC116164603 isoform X5 [Photinus pyralis]|uniref:uncharacterized protein LOC116164603 isoform X5 n=1 Tax=Photinus pyralis TaxID=7054 RepID=UPI001266FC57|nr:uncharacterized protein LOC116164603 isoform X5 [Photinus pyralis]